VGGVDEWILHAINAGTGDVNEVTFFVPLPQGGDSSVVAGLARGSTYRPQVVADSLMVTVLDANGDEIVATATVEVAADPAACDGAWVALTGDPASVPCSGDTAGTWVAASSSTDWSAVTGLRVALTFNPGEALPPGSTVDVTYSTVNAPLDTDGDGISNGGAPVDALVVSELAAYGQFGATYTDTLTSRPRRLSPAKAGVALRGSALEVAKSVTGDDSQRAPSAFEVTVACEFAWTDGAGNAQVSPVAVGGSTVGALALTEAGGLSGRLDMLPPETACRVEEAGAVGDYGEDRRSGPTEPVEATTLLVYGEDSEGNLVLPEVPTAQRVTLVNEYDTAAYSPPPDNATTPPGGDPTETEGVVTPPGGDSTQPTGGSTPGGGVVPNGTVPGGAVPTSGDMPQGATPLGGVTPPVAVSQPGNAKEVATTPTESAGDDPSDQSEATKETEDSLAETGLNSRAPSVGAGLIALGCMLALMGAAWRKRASLR
jgi:hypothetical protein